MKSIALIGLFAGILTCNPIDYGSRLIYLVILALLIFLEYIAEKKYPEKVKYISLFKAVLFILAFNLAALLYDKPLSETLMLSAIFGLMVYYLIKNKNAEKDQVEPIP